MAKQTLNNGDSGLDFRTKLNDNYTELYTKDGTQDSTISANTAAIATKADVAHTQAATTVTQDNTGNTLVSTDVQGSIVELANIGLSHATTSTPVASQTLTTTAAKIAVFETVAHELNGAVTATVDNIVTPTTTHQFLINKTGLYRIYGVVGAEFASADDVSLVLYKNGTTPVSPAINIQGRGAGKPVLFSYSDMQSLVATDYLEIWAFSSAASTATIFPYASMTVERMIF